MRDGPNGLDIALGYVRVRSYVQFLITGDFRPYFFAGGCTEDSQRVAYFTVNGKPVWDQSLN